jgi:divalent metal cation (Fe/Co/Zn/Cd) transporter
MPVPEHTEHTGRWGCGEEAHWYEYTCGCVNNDIAQLHYDYDNNGLCDACAYMVGVKQYYSLMMSAPEWLYEELKHTYYEGETVSVKISMATDVGFLFFVNGEELTDYQDVDGLYWEFTFKMPACDTYVHFKTYDGFLPDVNYGTLIETYYRQNLDARYVHIRHYYGEFASGAIVAMLDTGPYTDAIIGCAIAVYILIMGFKLVKESSNILIGTAPDAEFVHSIIKRIKEYEGVLGIHDLVVHSYGESKSFITVHVEVDSEESIMVSHELMDNIEADFLKDNINLVIHMDPVCINDPETNELKSMCTKIISDIASEYSSPVSMHDFRVVKGTIYTKVLFDVSISNDMPLSDKRLCEEINEEIKRINPLIELILTVDRDYFSARFDKL